MPIEPKTDIYLCATPINDLNNQVNFSSLSAQYNYFRSTAKHSYSSTTYIEPIDGEIDWYATAAEIMDCNYLMFRNTAYSSKWYYAFITEIKPTNSSNSCTISFKIDPWNTFYWDFSIKECYVLREHTATDAIGEHTQADGIGTGVTVNNESANNRLVANNTAILFARGIVNPLTPVTGVVDGYFIQNNYTGNSVQIFQCNSSGVTALNSAIGNIITDKDTISEIYLAPYASGGVFTNGDNISTKMGTGIGSIIKETVSFPRPSTLNGYSPRNNKLFSYPYCFFEITNNQGSTVEYAWEYFDSTPEFTIDYTLLCPGKACIYPVNSNYNQNAYSDNVETPPYPMCVYPTDSYAQWVADQGNAYITNQVFGIVSNILPVVWGNIASPITGMLNQAEEITNDINNLSIMQKRGNVVQGRSSTSSQITGGFTGFSITAKCPKLEYLHQIDDYFDRFGYQVNRVKKPEINSRPQWNYIKTKGAIVTGGIPKMFLDQICQMLDNGCTIWHNPSNVGNYSLNNKP